MLQKSIKNELQLCNAANHIFHCHELKFDEININSRTFFLNLFKGLQNVPQMQKSIKISEIYVMFT